MGWDPTVTLIREKERVRFRFELPHGTYTTRKIIQAHGADRLLSRGARVIEVVEDATGEICVLKDLWLDKTRKSESQLYDAILEDIRRIYGEVAMERAKLYLMTPKDSWFVKLNGKEDETKSCMLEKNRVDLKNQKSLRDAIPRFNPKITSESYLRKMEDTAEEVLADPEEIRHRVHHRVVFKEYATPVCDVPTLGDVCRVLADVTEGVYCLQSLKCFR